MINHLINLNIINSEKNFKYYKLKLQQLQLIYNLCYRVIESML